MYILVYIVNGSIDIYIKLTSWKAAFNSEILIVSSRLRLCFLSTYNTHSTYILMSKQTFEIFDISIQRPLAPMITTICPNRPLQLVT
jgi:hypothetical protein